MAVTLTTFRARYPEFDPSTPDAALDALIQACINDAEEMVDRSLYGTKADMAVKAYAAHLVATNPLGEYARLVSDDGRTTYLTHYESARKTVGAGCRVI